MLFRSLDVRFREKERKRADAREYYDDLKKCDGALFHDACTGSRGLLVGDGILLVNIHISLFGKL